jgi:pimeloyl-ACP methyl ester carboxylesterase
MRPAKRHRRGLGVFSVLVSGALLLGCSSSPLENDPTTDIQESVDAGGGRRDDVSAIAWERCGVIECAELNVPYDYEEPELGNFTLALSRRPAGDQAKKIGSLLVNPGGPGFGGTTIAEYADYYFSSDLLDSFDIVGWDPRGTGKSTPAVDCIDEYDPYFGLDAPAGNADEQRQLVRVATEFADACLKRSGEILPYISTRASAQDMDAIRQALGEETISYFGFSYGSQLGGVWVSMFPETVRAAVLDGASDPNAGMLDKSLAQAKGFEEQLQRFLDQCSSSSDCAFHNDGNAAGAFDDLVNRINANALPTRGARTPATTGVLFTAVAQAMYSDTLWPSLERALAAAQNGDGVLLLELYDQYYQRLPNGGYGNELEAFLAISCLDDPGPVGVEAADAVAPMFTEVAKRFGPNFASGYFCALWPVPSPGEVTVTGKGAGPVLVIGTTGDAATPLESSRRAARALEEGVFLIVEADQHTGYGLNACIVRAVDSYLIDLRVPGNETRCS